jgi:hypothetical protein
MHVCVCVDMTPVMRAALLPVSSCGEEYVEIFNDCLKYIECTSKLVYCSK